MKNMKGRNSSKLHQFSTSGNRRYPSASFSALLRAGAVLPLILIGVIAFTGATNLFGLNGVASATTSTITLSVTSGLSVDVMPSDNGTFASSTATNNVRVKTDSASGYELGIKASTSGSNNNALINTSDSSKIIPSITTSISEATYSSSSTYNNTWGFKPSKLNSQANSNYIPGPTSTTSSIVLDKTTSSNPSTFNDYTITLGTRIDNAQAPGSYANTFVITALANPTPYTITYNKNTTDTVTNMPNNVSSDTFSDQVTISNLVPARDGYNFKGWCTVQVADGGTCTGTTYNPDGGGTNLTWTLDQTQSSNSLTLYAMWNVAGINLYNTVASMSKGTQTLAQLRTAIDANNSGVYEYNTSVFGTASDAANTSKIYYYRGILDNTVGTRGSDGDNAAWPNTVLLDTTSNGKDTTDTCWRIVRTTGSGGVKMIYQGKWTGSTCANSSTNANAISSVYLNRRSTSSTNSYDTKGRIIYVGYNYSSTSSHQTDTSSIANSTLFVNGTASNLRTQLESWYNNNMTSWTSKLETSAGWCNDRTTYSGTTTSTKTTSNVPYKTSSATVSFGAYIRNGTTNSQPTLGCPNDTGYDLLSTSNGYIGVPSAPLTADEAAFAGSGYGSSSTPYHANSYLRSGDGFWLLSPYYRYYSGLVTAFYVSASGGLSGIDVSDTVGVRPSISLKPGSMAVSGSGTATDPWIVNPPKPMQEFTASDCSAMSTGDTVDLVDSRDGEGYKVGKLAGGKCWMLDNLRLDLTNSTILNGLTTSNTHVNSASLTSLKSGNRGAGAQYASSGFVKWDSSSPDNVYNQAKANADYKDTTTTSYGTGSGKIGVYYNYCAASAGSYCYDSGAGTGNAQYDLCPAGWRMPTSGSSGEYQTLYTAYSSDATSFKNALSTPLSGYFRDGSARNQGSIGNFWSSTYLDGRNMYRLYVNSSLVYPADYDNRRYGTSLRCLLGS